MYLPQALQILYRERPDGDRISNSDDTGSQSWWMSLTDRSVRVLLSFHVRRVMIMHYISRTFMSVSHAFIETGNGSLSLFLRESIPGIQRIDFVTHCVFMYV
jgi:hypothetical protein